MSKNKLHAVLAVHKAVKSRNHSLISELHKSSQKSELYQGMTRVYEPVAEDGEKLPGEDKIVQQRFSNILKRFRELLSEEALVTAQRDYANTAAKADIILNGKTVATDVPAPHLLYMEKELFNVRTFVDKLPTLDTSVIWTYDPMSSVHRTEPVKTHRTTKEQVAITLAPPTDKHPAQAQLITRDTVVGYWSKTDISGAIPIPDKNALLARIEQAVRAVKEARERANGVDVPQFTDPMSGVLDFVFAT